jgi:two-component system CheB/CheR fusion protein
MASLNGNFNQPAPLAPPSQDANDDFIVVGIGASAGGVEALEELFSLMPDKMGMAFIVVQHLSPDFESLMPQILARKTAMPVHSIAHNQKILPNNVYVLPSKKELIVQDRTLRTREQAESRVLNKPIDQFFASLASDIGKNAVGIVLSGTGTDCTKGVADIHEAEGLVIVQSETSAKFNGMPRSAISTGVVDAIESIDEIPHALIRFAEITNNELGNSKLKQFADAIGSERRIHKLLHTNFGIDFDQYKTDMFTRRVKRRMCLTKDDDLDKYLKRLETSPQELRQLYSDLLIGVTEFFRDVDAFNEMRLRILPAVLDAAAPSGELRIWVAPCATGEEAYSLAIIVDELLQSRDYSLDVKIFATDVNAECIEVASRGIYPEECLANVSADRVEKYFKKQDDGFLVSRELRKTIVFATHNILQDAPFTKLDLACCRNLLIYLKPEAKKKVISLLNFSLVEHGVMWLGPSESIAEQDDGFRVLNERWRVFRKIAPIRFSSVTLNDNVPASPKRKPGIESRSVSQSELLTVYDSLLCNFMPPGLLVDDDDQIVHVFGTGTKFLQIQAGRPARKFTELLPSTFRIAVANGLKRVKTEGKTICYSGIPINEGDIENSYQISIMPVDSAQTSPKFLVTFESFDSVSSAKNSQEPIDGSQANVERVQFLEEQLQSTRESLHDSILDLKSANEEMQTTNEELIASNEELQSTNEELHSVNEELYTVNSEHQRKITELIEMTDDMENLLDSIQVDTIFLDGELKVRKFTLGIAKTFRLIPQDVGRHIDSFNHELEHENIVGLVEDVLKNEKSIEEEVQDSSGNWFLMRLLPYSSRGQVDGVLLTLIDITKIKETEQRLAELSEIVQSSEDAIFRVTPDGIIRTWNTGSVRIFAHTEEFMVGKNISVLTVDEIGQTIMVGALDAMVRGERIEHIQMKAVRRNGELVDVQMSVSPIYNRDEKLVAASIVLRDFTKEKNAEAANLEAVRRRDQFLAMLSHELRNPIAAIMNALALLKATEVEQEQDQAARSVILRQSKQLAKLLDDLLDVSRITHDKIKLDIQTIDLVQLSNEVVEGIRAKLDQCEHKLTLDLPSHPVCVNADKTRIIQAQVNLLVNAAKYTPNGGQITYSISAQDDKAIIEIHDDGEGMNEELAKKVFEVFVQADQPLDRNVGGMGLGLPLVRMIARAHGGEISAFSEGPGKGSKFTLSFPLAEEQHLIESRDEEDDFEVLNDKKLLLVEDDDGSREMLSSFLASFGLEVAAAANGIDAVQLFAEFSPDICVVDIGLPDLNGYQVAERIRDMDHRPELLIALTGYGQDKDKKAVLEAGFDLHIVKPTDPDQLVATISSHLAKAVAR